MKIYKKVSINIFLSTLNFILFFVGYELIVSIFIPASLTEASASQIITIPYRGMALFISLLVILINFRIKLINIPSGLKMLLFFWIILIIRMFYDIFIDTEIEHSDSSFSISFSNSLLYDSSFSKSYSSFFFGILSFHFSSKL